MQAKDAQSMSKRKLDLNDRDHTKKQRTHSDYVNIVLKNYLYYIHRQYFSQFTSIRVKK
jgi:hypothetical protein